MHCFLYVTVLLLLKNENLKTSRSTAWNPSPPPPPPPGSTKPQLEKLRLLMLKPDLSKAHLLSVIHLLMLTTWGLECFVTRLWGLGCPTPLHGPEGFPWKQANWYLIWAADQIKFCELGSHLSEDGEEGVCIEISTPQVELLHIRENSIKLVGFKFIPGGKWKPIGLERQLLCSYK